ncbi:MAG: FHA domain-containing protein [Anaerolineales bacterium]
MTTRNFHPSSNTNNAFQIQILTAGQDERIVPVRKTGLTVGRKSDNDIVLDDPRVSDYHARIEQEDDHYRVIDLNSAGGTYLGEARLHPGVPADWPTTTALRIGENWLQLQSVDGGSAPIEIGKQARPSQPSIQPELMQFSPGKSFGVYVEAAQLAVMPGKSADVVVTLLNRGMDTGHFVVGLLGLPPTWAGALPPTVTAPPGAEHQFTLTFQPPQVSASRAGRYPITLQITDQNTPEERVEVRLTLTVLAYSHFVSTLHPKVLLSDDVAQLKIENQGNTPETFAVSVTDPNTLLKFAYLGERFTVPEGEASLVDIRATPRAMQWALSSRSYPFWVQIKAASGQAEQHEAELVTKSDLPLWLAPVLLLLGVCLCGGLMYALASAGITPTLATRTPTATLTVQMTPADGDGDGLSDADELRLGTNPALPDTDADGLLDGAEQRAGANPLVADSDGDTLSDGQEVFQFNTSPINPDTDGDGLLDNVDPDPGRLPTPTAIPPTATSPPPTPAPSLTLPPATATAPLPTITTPPLPTATVIPSTAVSPPPITVNGWIAFESNRDGNLELYLMRGDSRAELRLTNNTADDTRLVWASATNRMAFDSLRDGNSEIYMMNIDGTGQTRLTNHAARDTSATWSADGARLAFISERDGNPDVYAMAANGSDLRRLTNTPASECCPAWSPLGTLIGYVLDGVGIHRMNADGSNSQRLAAALSSPMTWSPDGARLVYVSDQNGNGEIYAINADSSGPARLTDNSALDTNPVFSPNGSQIAFISNRDGNPEVYVMNPDGSSATRLTNTPATECCLVWSPDGAQLAFASDRDGNYEIYVFDVRLGVAVRLTNNPAYDAPWVWRP